jgi:hypothetical protein
MHRPKLTALHQELQPWLQNVLLEHRKNLEMHLIQLHEGLEQQENAGKEKKVPIENYMAI